jgi:hypothetical protein
MRKQTPERGTTRIKKGFTFLPMTINKETRWLEHIQWEEKVVYWEGVFNHEYKGWSWVSTRWIND